MYTYTMPAFSIQNPLLHLPPCPLLVITRAISQTTNKTTKQTTSETNYQPNNQPNHHQSVLFCWLAPFAQQTDVLLRQTTVTDMGTVSTVLFFIVRALVKKFDILTCRSLDNIAENQ